MEHDTTLNDYFYSCDEKQRVRILHDIIFEDNGYYCDDLRKIDLNEHYINKIIEFNSTVSTINLITTVPVSKLTDNNLKNIFKHNHRFIKVYSYIFEKPLSEDVFQYALQCSFDNGEVIADHPDPDYLDNDIRRFISLHEPISDDSKKIIIKNNIVYLPFLEGLSESVKEFTCGFVKNNIDSKYDYRNINKFSQDVQCDIVRQYPYLYELIDNPSEAVNRELIEADPYWISVVNNQTGDLQLRALYILYGSNGIIGTPIFSFFKNPCKNVQYEAVRLDPIQISLIKDPNYDMQKLAVEHNPDCIKHIKHPYEDIARVVLDSGYWNARIYDVIKDNIHQYSNEFNHYFNKLKLKYGDPNNFTERSTK
ncbi:hypothetical protein PBI_SCTP2_227 [Salicola phage SCTP-2]|nr:hypothetical protein PBI_SCTP2_227 [Salicola phage SCTP-2]